MRDLDYRVTMLEQRLRGVSYEIIEGLQGRHMGAKKIRHEIGEVMATLARLNGEEVFSFEAAEKFPDRWFGYIAEFRKRRKSAWSRRSPVIKELEV